MAVLNTRCADLVPSDPRRARRSKMRWGRPLQASPEPAMAESAKPVELVQFDAASGKFSLGADALRALRAVRTPVAVVAVCGRARQGKSFILNQLLGRSRGFQVAPTHRPCTKGLWMWSAPVPRTAPDGSPYHLVLLDTEGIDAYDQTGQYSTQIFSLAVLLSSLFVYNQMGGIDEAALDRLSLVTEMTQHIRARSSEGPATGAELGRFAPSFLWLLRDFYLELEEDGRRIAPRDYLEAALRAVPGSGAAAASKNRIRESIKDLFPDRDCFTLVRPVNDERDLAHLDSLDPARLRSEFRQGLDRLTQTVFERARPKELGATVITGPMLAGLAEAYVGAINAGAVPTIQTAWQGVAEAECRRAADAALAAFAAALDLSATSGEEGAMREAYERAVEAAVAAFAEGAVGDAGVRAAHERRLRADLRARFDAERDREVHRAAEREREAADRARAVVAAAAHAPGATSAAVLRAALEAAGVFPTGARGAEAALRFLIRDVLPGDVARACERQDTELGKARDRLKTLEGAAEELREARTRVRELEAELAGARDRMKTLEGATEELREARARTRELETEVARVRGERDGLERAKEEVRREYQAQMERQRQEHERAMMHAREKGERGRQRSRRRGRGRTGAASKAPAFAPRSARGEAAVGGAGDGHEGPELARPGRGGPGAAGVGAGARYRACGAAGGAGGARGGGGGKGARAGAGGARGGGPGRSEGGRGGWAGGYRCACACRLFAASQASKRVSGFRRSASGRRIAPGTTRKRRGWRCSCRRTTRSVSA